tara:strand:- start:411 stop:866 length:456 start_codon:yes stop_codon:yes gene_type:complete
LTEVIFVILDPSSDTQDQVCRMIDGLYTLKTSQVVLMDSNEQAKSMDERLWTFDLEAFIPHNLIDEPIQPPPPVQIAWSTPARRFHTLIHMTEQTALPEQVQRYQRVIDLVPADDQLKEIARQRFKGYRQQGIPPQTLSFQDFLGQFSTES